LRGFGEGFGELLGEVWEGFGSSWEIFDVIFDEVTTHLKLRISSIEKKRSQERIWRGFGGGWEPLWKAFGVDLVHFKLEISSIDTDVLWN